MPGRRRAAPGARQRVRGLGRARATSSAGDGGKPFEVSNRKTGPRLWSFELFEGALRRSEPEFLGFQTLTLRFITLNSWKLAMAGIGHSSILMWCSHRRCRLRCRTRPIQERVPPVSRRQLISNSARIEAYQSDGTEPMGIQTCALQWRAQSMMYSAVWLKEFDLSQHYVQYIKVVGCDPICIGRVVDGCPGVRSMLRVSVYYMYNREPRYNRRNMQSATLEYVSKDIIKAQDQNQHPAHLHFLVASPPWYLT